MTHTKKWLQIAICLTLVLGLIGPAAGTAASAPTRMHPALAQVAQATPDQVVAVIVQAAGDTGRAERLVTNLGGRVTRDLHIINAFSAELPAGKVAKLARTDAVSWVSLDAPVASSGKPNNDPCASGCTPNYFLDTLNVQPVWDMGYRGEGVGVAIIDSGIFKDRDFTIVPGKPHTRVEVAISFNAETTADTYGHGTHVAGIAAGNGAASNGFYQGIAPKADLINLKVSNDFGMAYESHTVDAMQWVLENKDAYNIRVVNLSINSTVEQSYHTSPMDAAAEILWFNGIVVVTSAGNKGTGGEYNTVNAAPANDPFLITVGASNEFTTVDRSDDAVASFSAFGTTGDGFVKPDVVAPGKDIISVLASSSDWYYQQPDRAVLDKEYFRISGTSMAAPMVTGAVALLLQAEPHLTPDQVKYRLMNTGSTIPGSSSDPNTYSYLDVHALLTNPTTESANTGTVASQLLWTGGDPITWGSVSWNSVSWNSVSWNSVSWNSVSWNSVSWNSVSWED